jgi:hypothetical protein
MILTHPPAGNLLEPPPGGPTIPNTGVVLYSSRIDVQEAQRVDSDTVLGMTGSTGAGA